MSFRSGRIGLIPLILPMLAGAVLPASSQVNLIEDPFRDLPAAEAPRNLPSLPSLSFLLERSISVPGPLPGDSPRWHEGQLAVEVEGGVALADLQDESAPVDVVGPIPAADVDRLAWSLSPDGRVRVRVREDGRLLAQKRCRRCRRGWRRIWRLSLPGGADLAPPLVSERRVFVGAMDNRVYGLRRRNGHRLWISDVGARVTRRLALTEGDRPVLLAIQDDGSRLLAMDASTGKPLTAVDLGEGDGRFIGEPLPLPDGSIAVARQRYRRSEAALEIYRLAEQKPAPPPPGEDAPGEDSPENRPLAGPSADLRYTGPGSSTGALGP